MSCACQMGAGMWFGMLLPALVLAALIVVGVLIVRALWERAPRGDVGASSPLSLLEARYARGEIDQEELSEGGIL